MVTEENEIFKNLMVKYFQKVDIFSLDQSNEQTDGYAVNRVSLSPKIKCENFKHNLWR